MYTLALLIFAASQHAETLPPSPYDEVYVLELTVDDPALVEGRGPTVMVELEIEFSGTLHLWTRSELDLFLRVEDTSDGRLLAEDDDSGGGNVPYVRREVEEGARLVVLIASTGPEALGPLELHVVAAPETKATREAALRATDGLAEVQRLQQEGNPDAARSLIAELLSELLSTSGSRESEAIAGACWELGFLGREAGDLASSRAPWAAVRNHRERTLPAGDPLLLAAGDNLALTMRELGDLHGARALQEAVLEGRERTLPADHLALLRTRQNLAVTMTEMGDLPGARALQEAVLAGFERTLPADHPYLLNAQLSLATTMADMGDLSGARALQEAVLAAHERTLPADHPYLLAALANLATTIEEMGDLAGTRALQEAVLAACERTLSADHPYLLGARHNLARAMLEVGDLPGARGLIGPQVAGMRALVLGSLALAPRQATEAVEAAAYLLANVLFLTRTGDPDRQASVFELQETMRMVTGEAARALRGAENPDIRARLDEAGRVRAALGDLSSRSSSLDPAAFSAELTRLMQERDRLEREASRLQAEREVATRGVEIGPLAQALGEDAALVTYRRIEHWDLVEGKGLIRARSDHLLAHALAPDGSLLRIDLGEAAELEELVTAWRSAVGAPLLRGLAAEEEDEGDREQAAGEALRARLLDPVLAVLGEGVERLHVCADDLVFLVPLDALPFEGGRIGDRWSLANEVSCARLVAPSRPVEDGRGLLALGGVDYDAGAETEAAEEPASPTRSAMPHKFSRLLQTRFEAETTGALCEDLLGLEPVVLTRKDATKAALFEQASGKRWLHLATHGWFVDEATKSTLDEVPGERGWASMGVEERVSGMAPMLLCGVALAGANNPIDSLGRGPGILTAEELCSLDLSSCELAVLSGCETNAGIRRAGQGIQSLQAALYAAGARSSITSLWKVDDAATRRLFELFYTKLWEEHLPKAQALWQAKRALRDEGAPVRDWAAWVLTGDPE